MVIIKETSQLFLRNAFLTIWQIWTMPKIFMLFCGNLVFPWHTKSFVFIDDCMITPFECRQLWLGFIWQDVQIIYANKFNISFNIYFPPYTVLMVRLGILSSFSIAVRKTIARFNQWGKNKKRKWKRSWWWCW